MAKDRFKPLPWLTVFLAAVPGLLVALTRQKFVPLAPLLTILGYLYIGILVLAPPIIWWQRRRLPVWTLLLVGALAHFLTWLGVQRWNAG